MDRKLDASIEQVTAKAILEECFDEFVKKHYEKICAKLEIEEEDLPKEFQNKSEEEKIQLIEEKKEDRERYQKEIRI